MTGVLAAVPPTDVLFVFAHQDDEVGISTRIGFEAASGNRVWCVYLTDGGRAVAPAIRDAESRRVLRTLGVDDARIGFIADDRGRIADGALAAETARARSALREWIRSSKASFRRAYTLDWEGGHADHDAAHVVTLAAARDAGIETVYAFTLYNGYRRPRGLFRVASFVPGPGEIVRRRLAPREAFAAAMCPLAYPSQRRTWLALGPGLAARALVRRAEMLRRVQVERLAHRPHDGPLLYETMFGVPSATVLQLTAAVRGELLGTPPTS